MDDLVSNVESNAELKTMAMRFILREVCRKYDNEKNPHFTTDEVHKWLQGLGQEYLDLNIKDLFKGSGYIDVDDDYNLGLNDRGKQLCEDEKRR